MRGSGYFRQPPSLSTIRFQDHNFDPRKHSINVLLRPAALAQVDYTQLLVNTLTLTSLWAAVRRAISVNSASLAIT